MAENDAPAARLLDLLGKLRNELQESVDYLCGRRQTIGPFTVTDPDADNLPLVMLDEADIATAARYLLDLGLAPDAERLTAFSEGVRLGAGQLSLGITAKGLDDDERAKWIELFGPLPDCSDPDRPDYLKTKLVGACSRLLEYIDRLRKSVIAMFSEEGTVTLQQAAAIVNKTKSALVKRAKKSPMPLPEVEGGECRAAEWEWTTIRPWLEDQFKRKLPEKFPGGRFIRR
jgi:hypothetical protein